MIRAVALASLAAVLLAGDAGAGTSLAGPTWQLSKLTGVSRGVSSVTAQFTAAGRVSGFSGCNQYSGTYKVSGSSFRVAGPLATTQMACPKPQTLLERVYLKALTSARRYSISGSKLTLKGRLGIPLATLGVQSQALAGTSWRVLSYNNGKQAVVSVMAGTKLTAVFDAKGVYLSGSAGCNEYNATVKSTSPKITIGPVASTRKSCPSPEGVMTQEAAYLAALETAATFTIQGARLELRTADGEIVADFTRA
jgi:heat shock protein HslJ